MRLFIAIDFPPSTKKEIGSAIQPLIRTFPQVVWTKGENLHLTLKFLGEVKKEVKHNDTTAKIGEGIRKSCSQVRFFSLTFTKLGFCAREQLIIWLGAEAEDELFSLAERI